MSPGRNESSPGSPSNGNGEESWYQTVLVESAHRLKKKEKNSRGTGFSPIGPMKNSVSVEREEATKEAGVFRRRIWHKGHRGGHGNEGGRHSTKCH